MSEKRLHLLLVRFSSLGDVVVQTSVVTWLKATYGQNLRISFVTSAEFKDLLVGHPDIHRVISFDRKGGDTLSALAKKLSDIHEADPFDLMLDLHATTRSWLLRLKLWWIPRLVVDKRRFERFMLVGYRYIKLRAIKKPWQQVWRTPLDWQGILLAPLKDPEGMTFTAGGLKSATDRPYAVLAPVASFAMKHWPIKYYVEIAQRFLQDESFKNWDLVVIAGPEDKHCQAFDVIQHERFKNLQGKTKLKESLAWMQQAKLVLGNDSGMNHVAEAAAVPVLTIFGPTHEAFGFAPHLKKSVALSLDVACRPCSTTGKKDCFRSEQVCMTQLTPDIVWREFKTKAMTL
ncbi:MAG: glycosyltransferase family 9 protein [Bacteriovoracia bacterium]